MMRKLWQKIDRFNFWIMSSLADLNATPWMFYMVCFGVLKILSFQRPVDAIGWTNYVVQTFYQGAALPLISFISKREGNTLMGYLVETHAMEKADVDRDRAMFQEMHVMIHEIRSMHHEMKCRLCDGQPELEDGSEI